MLRRIHLALIAVFVVCSSVVVFAGSLPVLGISGDSIPVPGHPAILRHPEIRILSVMRSNVENYQIASISVRVSNPNSAPLFMGGFPAREPKKQHDVGVSFKVQVKQDGSWSQELAQLGFSQEASLEKLSPLKPPQDTPAELVAYWEAYQRATRSFKLAANSTVTLEISSHVLSVDWETMKVGLVWHSPRHPGFLGKAICVSPAMFESLRPKLTWTNDVTPEEVKSRAQVELEDVDDSTKWTYPRIRLLSAKKRVDSGGELVEMTVEVTNTNDISLVFFPGIKNSTGKKGHDSPLYTIEMKRDGQWVGGALDNPVLAGQDFRAATECELAAHVSTKRSLFVPRDWQALRVGFSWMARASNGNDRRGLTWSKEVTPQEMKRLSELVRADHKEVQQSAYRLKPPELRILSVTRHETADFGGTSLGVEVSNPNSVPLSYYGFKANSFSPPIPEGIIAPLGKTIKYKHGGEWKTHRPAIDCLVGYARLELPANGKATFSVWLPFQNDREPIKVGFNWLTGNAGVGFTTAWSKEVRDKESSPPSGQ